MRVKRFADVDSAKTEDNICGVLVHVMPERMAAVGAALKALPGVEVHAEAPNGRLVVTVEDADGEWAGVTLARIPAIDGVISAALIYQSTLTAEETTP